MVEKSLQSMQTAFANLSIQGSNTMNLLAKSSSKNMKGLDNNMKVGEVGAQDLQTGLANAANEGSQSLNALAKASSKSMNGF